MQISVKVNVGGFTRYMSDMEKRQVPFATALALTQTARDAVSAEKEEIKSAFEEPTPYTLNALRYEGANKANLTAKVAFKDARAGNPASGYLAPEIEGGARTLKKFERALAAVGVFPPSGKITVPGSAAVFDRYGNMARTQINKVLAALRQGKSKDYFAGAPGKPGQYPPGVWLREGRKVLPVILFVSPATYRKRYRFYEVVEQVVRERFQINFTTAMDKALKTAR